MKPGALRGTGGEPTERDSSFRRTLNQAYAWYTIGLILFILIMAGLEQAGMQPQWIGYTFLMATILVCGVIGVMCRTTDPAEYYVAGRRVPAFYNGLATGADWMSAASFIGLAGTLYLSGFSGLAFVMGWTGGYCLVAFFLAPYLRKFGQFTIPDFLGERYGGHTPRVLGVGAALLCSFVYLVAQIYGVGLITSHLTGLPFEIGIFVGLGGILLCSFLGGMRAVTWTQAAQCVLILLAYLVPVVWLSVQQTGVPLAQVVYGQQLEKVSAREAELLQDPAEQEVIEIHRQRVRQLEGKLLDVRGSMQADRQAAQQHVADLMASQAPLGQVQAAQRHLKSLPVDEAEAERRYLAEKALAEVGARPLAGMPVHAAPYRVEPSRDAPQGHHSFSAQLNFLALMFCLMVGTASLPHILMRFYTTAGVREARESVAWSLLFICMLYFTAPALAVLVKYEIFSNVVGLPFDKLPAWMSSWSRVDASLLSVSDINKDGVIQLGELSIGGDIITLAVPQIGGMPHVVTAMVAAGGLAAALSTADGLLLTIANGLSHDLYFRVIDPHASTARRVAISKALLLVVALAAAAVAAQKPADILFLVSAAFSMAASAFFPVLVLGIFWKRTTGTGACWGMVCGLLVTGYYMVRNQTWLRRVFGVVEAPELWWGIQPISAGVFGVAAGFAATVLISLLTRAPSPAVNALVDDLRIPGRIKSP